MENQQSPVSNTDFEQLADRVRHFVHGRVKNATTAEDLVQLVLIKISRSLNSLVHNDRVDAWARQIAKNVIHDYFRSAKPQEEFREEAHSTESQPLDSVTAEESEMKSELADYIRSEVEKLPPHYREALLRTEYEGVSQTELAKELGLPFSTVKSRVQRARLTLKSRIEECCNWVTDTYGTVIDVKPRKEAGNCEGCEDSC